MWQSIKNKIIRKLGGIVKEDLPHSIQNDITLWQVRVMGDFAKATQDRDAADTLERDFRSDEGWRINWRAVYGLYAFKKMKDAFTARPPIAITPENVDIRDEEQCPHYGILYETRKRIAPARWRDTGGWFRAWWNGEEQCWAREVEVIVGKSPKKTWWCAELEGTKRKAIEVKYDGSDHTFLLDNEDGSGFFKVTLGRGSPQVGHRGLPKGTRVVRVIEK